jgi:hypothetical protein
MINFEILLPNKDPFKLKIMCKGLTFVSSMPTGIRDLKTPKASSFLVTSSINSWKILRSVSSLAPLNPTRGKCGHDKTNHSKEGRDKNGDTKLQLGEGWIRNYIDLLRLSCLFACMFQCNSDLSSCPSN